MITQEEGINLYMCLHHHWSITIPRSIIIQNRHHLNEIHKEFKNLYVLVCIDNSFIPESFVSCFNCWSFFEKSTLTSSLLSNSAAKLPLTIFGEIWLLGPMLASSRLDPKCGFFSLISAQKKIYLPIAIQISKYLLVMPKCQDFLVLGYFYGSLDNIPRHPQKIHWFFPDFGIFHPKMSCSL